MKTKRILITGGAGYVGSRLTPLLLEAGYKVRIIDLCLYGEAGIDAVRNNSSYAEWNSHFEILKADIRDPDAVHTATQNVDTVIHLAAISNDPTGELNEVLTRQVNFDAVGLLLTISRKNGVRRFINASSSSVYGIKHETNVTEALEPEPITFYSKYKMLSEWLVYTAHSNDFITTNVRPATICGYSPRQRFDLTVNKLTADGFLEGLITVHGGEQRRPNVGITDVITFYKSLIEIDAALINGRTFNLGFENLKVIDIAKKIQTILAASTLNANRTPELVVTSTLDQRDYHISADKVVKVLGFTPQSSIENEVKMLLSALAQGEFPTIEAPKFYNMKSMQLALRNSSYQRFSE